MKMEMIFIPSPATGHLMATVEMAERLLDENNRLSITVIIISFNSKTTSIIAALTAASNTRLRYEVISGEEQPTDLTATDSHVQILKPLVKDAVAKLLEQTRPDSPRLAGFVVDMYCTCMIDVADEFGVPSYLFYTSNAGFLGLLLHMQFMYAELVVPSLTRPYPLKCLPYIFKSKEWFSFFRTQARRFRETKGILVNTVAELEPHALKFLSNGDSDTPPAYSVGPVLHLKNDTDGSGHRFLWSLRRASPNVMKEPPREFSNLEEILPEGFIDGMKCKSHGPRISNMKARGKVIGWAPQAAVLEKPAVGGFISHGGWNSTLESLWFGVPTAIWPLYAEQKFNTFEMVEELGLSVEIRKYWRGDLLLGRTEMELVTAEEIERGIRVLMEQGSDVRKRVKEISEKCTVALMDGGSSRIALRKFLQDVADNIA
ncbi:hypothetical protein HID58_067325 [Brassica napus]|uniref:Glycosyltransferase n=2 Tax=Brassica napus TaxID=3708 RepID=A0ABQ7ZI82_BRANA|nr:hypothetical protein HID58_067325 [Brassica napus]